MVGVVTSCSIDSEGYQLGQAYLKNDFQQQDTPLQVFAGAARTKLSKPFEALTLGDKAPVPIGATVLSRFPKRN